MAVQSLYRRYRPRRFADVRGQEHVVRVLGNAVREGTVSHAYLFSGPRGTGKTSTARILAKALNCTAPADGEPCCACASCLAVEAGSSLDVIELDAASNRGVDDMRDLVGRVALGTAGRTKLYILDEVHMLTKDASNTLLKTLEEPPAHVVFVLATTEPEKVLPTIRSRTQHLEFRLLPAGVLSEHLRWVASDAGLDLLDEAVEAAVRRGAGSARDALSALDQIAAAGGAHDDDLPLDELGEALCAASPDRALAAVARACDAGRDPRHLASALLSHLRDAFLSLEAPGLVALPDRDLERIADQGRRLGRDSLLRALDEIGEALATMRDAPDPRIPLEVALVRLTRGEQGTPDVAELAERIARLERSSARSAAAPSGDADRSAVRDASPSAPGPRGAGRPALGGVRRANAPTSRAASPPAAPTQATQPSQPAQQDSAPATPSAAAPAPAELPTRDELTLAWGDSIVGALRPAARARFAAGRFIGVEDGAATFALPNAPHLDQCETRRAEVEQVLAAHFGRPVPLRLVVDSGEPRASPAAPADGKADPASAEEAVDPHELADAPAQPAADGVSRLTETFPGAEVVEE